MSGKPPAQVELEWIGGHAFSGGRANTTPRIILDGDGKQGPSPVDGLLLALAGCTGYDIVDILEKRRTPLEAFSMQVRGERFDGVPARITSIHIVYTMQGATVERVHAERAVELALTKYCSVRDSIDPNMPISYDIILNGERTTTR